MTTRRFLGTRFFSFGALTALVTGIGYGGHEGYRAATDSFVAPVILSPDNDVILANKLKLSELKVEREKTVVEIETIDSDVAAAEKAIAGLEALREGTATALAWTTTTTAQRAAADAEIVKTLADEKTMLEAMAAAQQKLAGEVHANAEIGLVSRTDDARAAQDLQRTELALLETNRAKMQSELDLRQATLATRSLANTRGAPAMPEVVMREEQVVHLDLELLKLHADVRAKRAERRLATDKLAKLRELETELEARPIFRAVERSLDLAFVPYTQLDGVRPGAIVYDCAWGLFRCKPVGTIAELVPGETVLPDPWGRPARGQYAVLELTSRAAARAKVLRVRASIEAPPETKKGEPISAR